MKFGQVRVLVPMGADAGGRFSVSGSYVRAIRRAGGEPFFIPGPVQSAEDAAFSLAGFGGLLLTGGVDLDPAYVGELPHPVLGEVDPDRDALEWALLGAALTVQMPILGICRGCQVLAARVGGELYQDLATEVPGVIQHSQKAPRWHESHAVAVELGTQGAAVLGGVSDLRVNSFHHQAVKRLPSGWKPFAWAPDGVLEGFEQEEGGFALGIQWHPEDLVQTDPVHGRIFTAFVEAARRFLEVMPIVG